MPEYGRHQYGRIQYGKYKLVSDGSGSGLGPHVSYRIRTISHDGKTSDYLTMCRDRISIPSAHKVRTRLRTNDEEWVYTQNETIQADAVKVRIRSIESDGGMSEWIYADRGHLK